MRHRRDAPDRDGDGIADARAYAINESPHQQQPDCVGGHEGVHNVAVLKRVPSDLRLQQRIQQAEDLAVHVVDGGGEKYERADRPTIMTLWAWRRGPRAP